MPKRIFIFTLLGILTLFGLVQLVPYGRSHSNPPVTTAIKWDSPNTKSLFTKACADCHSNETYWPWYSNVAPVSWLIQNDVDAGRDELNISVSTLRANRLARSVQEGEMPPLQYKLAHPGARLSDANRLALIAGLQATFGPAGPGGD